MRVIPTELPGVLEIEARLFRDDRGYFLESHHGEKYGREGIPGPFVQDNVSFSRRGVLRGLHFQNPRAQGKLVSALLGEIFDVAVDIRRSSPHFGRWVARRLSAENGRQLYIPPGFAHGLLVLSETALVHYKCTDVYVPECEATLRWDDPDIAVEWPEPPTLVSPKDAEGLTLSQLGEAGRLFD